METPKAKPDHTATRVLLTSQMPNRMAKLTMPKGHQLNGAKDRVFRMPATRASRILIIFQEKFAGFDHTRQPAGYDVLKSIRILQAPVVPGLPSPRLLPDLDDRIHTGGEYHVRPCGQNGFVWIYLVDLTRFSQYRDR